MDWSKEIVEDATIEDLDEEAIKRARELFSKRQSDRKKAQEVLKKLSDIEVLNKAGITIKGKITRTALLLLGKVRLNISLMALFLELPGHFIMQIIR